MTSIKETAISALNDFLESEKFRLLNLVPVGIGIGICFYFSLDNEPCFAVNVAIFVGLLCTYIFTHYQIKMNLNTQTQDKIQFIKFGILALLTISLGALVSHIRTNSLNTFMMAENIKKPISFSAKIETCEKTDKGIKFIVSDAHRKYDDAKNTLCKKFSKLHLIWIGKKAKNAVENYTPGSCVLFRATLSPIQSQSFPGAYDFKKQQFFKEISARGFLVKAPQILDSEKYSTAENEVAAADAFSVSLYIERLRHLVNQKIESYLQKDIAAVMKALTTGNTSGITKEIRANFANSGTAHILAISGLHMGIIGFFIFWVVRIALCLIPQISMFYDIKKIAACVSWFFTLFYLFFSGRSVSSTRSFIMYTLIMLAVLINRTAVTMRSVAIAATLIMIPTPEAIMFPSFQLSFGAVIGIVAFYECKIKFPRFLRSVTETTATTIAASIPTSIISVFIFNQLTLNSIIANIICIPMMGLFIMPMAVVSLFMMLFGISKPFLFVTGIGVALLIKVAEETAKLPGSFFVMHSSTNIVYGTIVMSGLWLTLIHHKIRFLGIFGVIFGIAWYFLHPLPDVFVSQHAKIVGTKVENSVIFNHLGCLRSVSENWAKSVGISQRNNYKTKAMQKYVTHINHDTYSVDIRGKKIIITKSGDYRGNGSEFAIFHLRNEENEFAELIYLDSNKIISNKSKHRPWS